MITLFLTIMWLANAFILVTIIGAIICKKNWGTFLVMLIGKLSRRRRVQMKDDNIQRIVGKARYELYK